MSHMKPHENWFSRTTGNASGRAAADRAGIPPATLNRQLSRGHLTAETVIAIARGYDVHPVGALVATGYLTEDEGLSSPVEELAHLMSDQALLRILAMRIDDNPNAWAGTFDEVLSDAPVDQLAFERSNVHQLHVGDMDDDEMPEAAVAYSGPDEDALRKEDDGD